MKRKILIVLAVVIALTALIFIVFHGQRYFSRREIKLLDTQISSFGQLSPLVVFSLILLSTIIPPLPLPIPLIEITAGLIFGLWSGFLLIWISQIISSLLAFFLARFFRRHLFKNILLNHIWDFYRQYLESKGAMAVFVIRISMAAPFNIISYLAGLTHMRISQFLMATILGTIPEAILFAAIGVQLKNIHVRLWYLFIALIILGIASTFIIIHSSQRKK